MVEDQRHQIVISSPVVTDDCRPKEKLLMMYLLIKSATYIFSFVLCKVHPVTMLLMTLGSFSSLFNWMVGLCGYPCGSPAMPSPCN